MAADFFGSNGDGIARAAKIFQQLFAKDPAHECLVRIAVARLRDVIGSPADRTRISAYFQRQGITYRRDQIAAAWTRAETILAYMDNKTKASEETSRQSMGTAPNSSFESRRASTGTNSSKTKAAKDATSDAWRYDFSHNPGPDYTWVPKCSYKKDGHTVRLRGHWRKRKTSKADQNTAWKFDRTRRPGENWSWSNGFETKSGYSVRGHWRATRKCWKKSKEKRSRDN